MDLNNFTIPPELFYSSAPSETWKPKKQAPISPKASPKAIVTKHFPTNTTFKRKKFKISGGPELGRIGKIRRVFTKKKQPLKQKALGRVLTEKSSNIIQHLKGLPDDHEQLKKATYNNNITVKPPTKEEERLLRKEIKEKEDIIQKRLFNNENFERKRFKGSSFKFFKSKNVRGDESDPSTTEDDDLVPEIRDYSSKPSSGKTHIVQADIHQTPAIVDPIPFEDEADGEPDSTTIIIESLLQNLDEPECETSMEISNKATTAMTGLDSLIATLEGEPAAKKVQEEARAEVKQKLKIMGLGKNQLQIDAGQKKFGFVECKECGFSYNTNVPEDENIHNKHHQAVTSIPRFRGWATEEAMMINDWSEQSGRIIRLQPKHKNQNSEFVKEIVGKMEMEFGIQDDYESLHVYLAAFDFKIVGLATVMESVVAKKDELEKCTRLGIQRLYVRPEFRRKGVGKAMLKTIAIMHHKGELLDLRQDLAFSSPTEDGKKLIESVVGTSKVFTFSS